MSHWLQDPARRTRRRRWKAYQRALVRLSRLYPDVFREIWFDEFRQLEEGYLTHGHPVCFNGAMNGYSIKDRTEAGEVSILTIEQANSHRCWTLISTATGADTLVSPSGTHVDLSRDHGGTTGEIVAWIVANV